MAATSGNVLRISQDGTGENDMKCWRYVSLLAMFVAWSFLSGCMVYTFKQKNNETYYCKLPKASFTVYATRKRGDPPPDYSWVPSSTNGYYAFSNTNTVLLQQIGVGKELAPSRKFCFSRLRNDDPYRCKLLCFSMEESGLAILSIEGEEDAKHEMQVFLKGRKVRALKCIK